MMPPGDDAPPPALSHLNDRGEAHMVDVSAKAVTARIARAGGFVRMQAATLDLIESGTAAKGDVLATAASLNDDTGALGHLVEQRGKIAFELGDRHGLHAGQIARSGQVVKLSDHL